MKTNKRVTWIGVAITFGSVGLLILIVSLCLFSQQHFEWGSNIIDTKVASEIGGFLNGFVGIFWTAAGVVLVYATFNEQQKLAKRQHFEASFFSLLNSYNHIVQTTKGTVKKGGEEYLGRNYFSEVLKQIKNGLDCDEFYDFIKDKSDIPEVKEATQEVSRHDFQGPGRVLDELKERYGRHPYRNRQSHSKQFIVAQYEFFYNQHKSHLGHYFRFIYNIFKYTIREEDEHKDIQKYLNIIQAQMSTDELGLLFYNALSENGISSKGEKRFYNWLNDFQFLENIHHDSLIHKDHQKYYPNIKFKFSR